MGIFVRLIPISQCHTVISLTQPRNPKQSIFLVVNNISTYHRIVKQAKQYDDTWIYQFAGINNQIITIPVKQYDGHTIVLTKLDIICRC